MKTYIENRTKVISDIINNAETEYRNDKDMISSIVDLTIALECAEPNEEFVNDLRGFIMWAGMTNQDRGRVLSTLIHDLSEFARNRHENWFCPRTTGYSKYLSGASGVTI